MSDAIQLPPSFNGRARLFPLPNLVVFPHVVQPLHVFESRYREMVEDALAGDQLIAMGLLARGWEDDYHGRPDIEPVVCLGRVVTHARQPDGCYNMLLVGLRRAQVIRELPPLRAFREIEIGVMTDIELGDSKAESAAQREELIRCFRALVPASATFQQQLEQLTDGDLSLGMLTDVLAFTLDLPLELKQQLLSEPDVHQRAQRLLHQLRSSSAPRRGFPPDFSEN